MAGSRLGVLLDGQAILGGCGNRMDPPTAYVFPAAYDRITVLKGPQTVVHGPGNSAGVVLFDRTPTRYDRPAFQVFASPVVGSWGRNDELGSVEVGASRGYFSVSANRSAMDDYEDGHGESVHAGYERWSANGTVGWTPDGSTRIEVLGALSDGEAAYADRAMDGVAFTRQNVGLRVGRQHITPILQALEGQAFYNYVDHVMDNYSLRTFVPSMTMPFPAVSNPDRRTVGARANADLQLASRTTATLGADWQGNRHTIRSSSNEPLDPYDTHPRTLDAEFENAGAFGEVTQAVGRTGRVVAGARVDWWTGTDERSTVRIGMGAAAVQVPNPTAGERRREVLPSGFGRYEHAFGAGSSTFYAGVGHVARAPDYWELVSKESAASVSAFDTVPERTTQIDAGVLYRRGAVSGSLSGFANTISNYILIESNFVKASTSPSGMTVQRKATITRNVDASSWGGEATLAWEVVRRFTVDTSLAFVRGQNDTDDLPLAQQPPLEGRVALQYAADRWSMAALARLVAAQDRYALNQGNIVGQDLGPAPGFAVLSLNGSWRLARFARLSAGVDNLLDTTYAEFISRGGANVPGFTTTTRVNEPGRTLWIKLDVRN
jgi:iron complex outermembrane receptor protein